MPSDPVEALVWLVTEGAACEPWLPTCLEQDQIWLSVYGEHVAQQKPLMPCGRRSTPTANHDPGVNVTRRAMGQARMKYLERSRRACFYPPFARDDSAAPSRAGRY